MDQRSTEILDQAIADAKQQNRAYTVSNPPYDFAIFDSYRAVCDNLEQPPLPVQKECAVAYLLMRAAEGALDAALSVEMGVIARFHLLVPQRGFGDIHRMALRDFQRAVGLAQNAIARDYSIHQLPHAARQKALELFPRGIIPERLANAA